ncbi:MAG: S8 family serine peptidase [Dehalococcoidales bacterium]|nr:S8 family serine peptidase [Dehalococcoidales bacterium]
MKILKFVCIIAIVLSILLVPSGVAAASNNGTNTKANITSENILVKFNSNATPADIALINRQNEGQIIKTLRELGVQVITVPAGKAREKVQAYRANPKVAYAELDYIAQTVDTPNDPYLSQQWGLTKVEAAGAWGVTTGNTAIKIAILDTGVDLDHPDLAGKIVVSTNFTTSTSANDVAGHGTHVAGIAAASTNNGTGTAGLGYNSSIMNVKVMGDDGSGYYSWVAQGIIWAADNGANVINMSLGGSAASTTLESAINYAWSKGVVIVAAAGNSGSSAPSYPAYYSNVIAAAATDSYDRLASYSNYGDWVDVAAPGSGIYSTLINGSYGYATGTSMASPFVAGLAGLVFTRVTDTNNNKLLNDEVRTQIEAACDNIGVSGIGQGRINAYKAVQTSSTITTGTIVGAVTDLASGLPIPNATITDGLTTVITDANGNYAIANLPAGNFTLTASAADYGTESQSAAVAAEQTTTANFALTKEVSQPAPVQSLWVNNIDWVVTGKNLRLNVQVATHSGGVAGAQVKAQVCCSTGQVWNFTGVTDSSGSVSFVVRKPGSGTYTATVTDITVTGFVWDDSQGVSSTTYTINAAATVPDKRTK